MVSREERRRVWLRRKTTPRAKPVSERRVRGGVWRGDKFTAYPEGEDIQGPGGTRRAIAWADLLTRTEVTSLLTFQRGLNVAGFSIEGSVLLNPELERTFTNLGETLVGRLQARADHEVEHLIHSWKWVRQMLPLQVRLFFEQAFYLAGGKWRSLVTGFGVVLPTVAGARVQGGPNLTSNGKLGDAYVRGSGRPKGRESRESRTAQRYWEKYG